MAEKRNLTIRLDADLVRKARALAMERSVSVSRLVAEELERLISEEEQYGAACRQALDDLSTGFHLGGAVSSREQLHERRGQTSKPASRRGGDRGSA
jgi:predicted transcriptional regulator